MHRQRDQHKYMLPLANKDNTAARFQRPLISTCLALARCAKCLRSCGLALRGPILAGCSQGLARMRARAPNRWQAGAQHTVELQLALAETDEPPRRRIRLRQDC